MLIAGAVAGIALGSAAARYTESLLYQVKTTEISVFVVPALAIFVLALVAALPAVLRAVRIDPVAMLRPE